MDIGIKVIVKGSDKDVVLEPIFISDNAIAKVAELIKEEDVPGLMLRAFVTGGGCSGFQYDFTFDNEVKQDDYYVESGGIGLVVDQSSHKYLAGSTIDYIEDLGGAEFVVNNPSATTGGCGSSSSCDKKV